MAITFPAAPSVTPNRIRYVGVVEPGGGGAAAHGDLTRATILAALPPGPLKAALAAVSDADWEGDNLFQNPLFSISFYPVVSVDTAQTVPISIASLVVADVPLLRFFVPANAVEGLLYVEVAFIHSMFR